MNVFLSIGSGPGNGLATAERFAREGFRVVLCARTKSRIEALAHELLEKGYAVDARVVDASNPEAIAALIDEVEADIGPIDVVHYNAASMRQATLLSQPLETLNADLAINIGGALAAAQAAARRMSGRGRGTILFTGGGFGFSPSPDFLSLSVGKAGIHALTQGLFESLKEQGIHVGSVVVKALISPRSKDADGVAEQFWRLHNQERAHWSAEVAYPA